MRKGETEMYVFRVLHLPVSLMLLIHTWIHHRQGASQLPERAREPEGSRRRIQCVVIDILFSYTCLHARKYLREAAGNALGMPRHKGDYCGQ